MIAKAHCFTKNVKIDKLLEKRVENTFRIVERGLAERDKSLKIFLRGIFSNVHTKDYISIGRHITRKLPKHH